MHSLTNWPPHPVDGLHRKAPLQRLPSAAVHTPAKWNRGLWRDGFLLVSPIFWYKRFIKLQFQWGKWGFITILNPPTLGAAYFHPISCWRCSQAASFPIFLLLNLMIVTLDFVQVAELILIRKGPHKESTWGGMNLSRSHCIGPMLGLIRVETTYRAFWKLATPWSSQIGHSVKGKPGWWKRDKKGQPNSSKHQSICPKFYSHFSCRLLWPFW